ncbi:hypothetical protein [Kineosporia babensis]|uniref:DprA winged helix domain-containing protein n=1 Tax=Kineosporia babensis TaxID=499548 RepID=A0A9X1NNE3_9ACTN|nr:hypothetical protein [Kineosporia babensis]MCD5316949.1 hypothetical protein [Kineosporia babensis]
MPVVPDGLDIALGGKTLVGDDLRIAGATPPHPRRPGDDKSILEILSEGGGQLSLYELAQKLGKNTLVTSEIVLQFEKCRLVVLDGLPGDESVRLPR